MILETLSEEWYNKLQEAADRERLDRYVYDRHYSNTMTYDRFKFIQYLEREMYNHRIDESYARELIRKYDETP